MKSIHRQFALLGTLLVGALAFAQPVSRLSNMTPALSLVPTSMITPAKQPCVHPTEPFDIDDYSGPLNGLVARFSQRLESTTVHIPRHKSDLRPCSLSASDKFHMFVESTADPLNYVGAAWDAATAQLDRDDPSYRWALPAMENALARRLLITLPATSLASFFIRLFSGKTRAITALVRAQRSCGLATRWHTGSLRRVIPANSCRIILNGSGL